MFNTHIKTNNIFLGILFLFFCSTSAIFAKELNNIDPLKWEKRIILINSDKPDSTVSVLELKNNNYEIRDRDIVWFVLSDSLVQTNYPEKLGDGFAESITSEFFKDPHTCVLLIGKDGGIKEQAATLNLQRLFALIDAMPMRRIEMKKQ